MSPVSLARFCTTDSWLPKWSHDDAAAYAATDGLTDHLMHDDLAGAR